MKSKIQTHTSEIVHPIKENIPALVHAGWVISKVLWLDRRNSKKQMLQIKDIIRAFIMDFTDPYKGFMEFSQRILLERQRLITKPYDILHLEPLEWFATKFMHTKFLFTFLQETRKNLPLYMHELKEFSEGILIQIEDGEIYYGNILRSKWEDKPLSEDLNFLFLVLEYYCELYNRMLCIPHKD